ncbi:YveK family protein [Paenibacillus protaetiae]|uniref:Lipopolysaccharide biosynthesis protein n=1 Tax=Paenibacillus protaetiae TaxID=2509456 RepID=A0A4P6EY66_9BACL|nr:Wzz/FepE/Etk N-terminal domain-containing protein [Paenibacillus protaetiae]QAY67776.1 lipopolysaccharide biosynthesis protein [Paenibacillus protaetiae]
MSNELELKDYFLIIRKRLALIIAIVVCITAITAVYSIFFKDPIYEASTKIIVNRTSAQAATQDLDINEINSNIKIIDTYKEIIKTPAILDKVAAQHPELGLSAKQLAGKIKVSSVNNTQVMTVVVTDVSYPVAARAVNAVSEVFQQEIPHVFNVENVSILNKADVEDDPSPVSPNVPLNIVIGFVVSLMLAVGISFLLEYMDDTIKTEADVQRYLGQPTLALIAKVNPNELSSKNAGLSKNKNQQAGEWNSVTIGK